MTLHSNILVFSYHHHHLHVSWIMVRLYHTLTPEKKIGADLMATVFPEERLENSNLRYALKVIVV